MHGGEGRDELASDLLAAICVDHPCTHAGGCGGEMEGGMDRRWNGWEVEWIEGGMEGRWNG